MRAYGEVRFRNRRVAGRLLGNELGKFAGRNDVVVLGLPRGGVPVAVEVARRIGAPLDVLVVKKLGAPFQPELALGAVASFGAVVMDETLARHLGVTKDELDAMKSRAFAEVEARERLYRGERPLADLRGKTVIVVDDGLATGSTMRAAVKALRSLGCERLVVAVPVSAPDTAAAMAEEDGVEQVVCLAAPEAFFAVGEWYEDFSAVSDDQVRALLASSASSPAGQKAFPSGRITPTREGPSATPGEHAKEMGR